MEGALLEWLNTFELDRSCNSINDIVDGVILVNVMSQVNLDLEHSPLLCVSKHNKNVVARTDLSKAFRFREDQQESWKRCKITNGKF